LQEEDLQDEIIDNIHNVAQIYSKDLLTRDAKVLRSREVDLVEGSGLEMRMEQLLKSKVEIATEETDITTDIVVET
jgi:hypothetical protein